MRRQTCSVPPPYYLTPIDRFTRKIEAIVETIQPTGADWIVGLIVSGKSVFAISSEQPTANVGQKVGLSFKLEGLHVFDDNDQSIKYV